MRRSNKALVVLLAIAAPSQAAELSNLDISADYPFKPGEYPALKRTGWKVELPDIRYPSKASLTGLRVRLPVPRQSLLLRILSGANPWAMHVIPRDWHRFPLLMTPAPEVLRSNAVPLTEMTFAQVLPVSVIDPPAYAPWHFQSEIPFSPWSWDKDIQLMASSLPNLPMTELGTRLSTRGKSLFPVPLLRGYGLGYIEHQTLFYQTSNHDYGNVLTSFALTHPLFGPLQVYEGTALVYREGLAEPLERCDFSWFLGVGITHRHCFGTLTLEKYQDQTPGGSYYSQTLRGGLRQDFAESTVLLQGSIQRVDPVVRQTPSLRCALYASYERYLGKAMSLGLQCYWGLPPLGSETNSRLDIGPTLRIRF